MIQNSKNRTGIGCNIDNHSKANKNEETRSSKRKKKRKKANALKSYHHHML